MYIEHCVYQSSLWLLYEIKPLFNYSTYCTVRVEGLPEPVISLEDSGSEIGMVDENIIKHLNLPVLGKILIRPVVGQTVEENLVPLRIKPH